MSLNINKRKLVLPANVAPLNKKSTRANSKKNNNGFDIDADDDFTPLSDIDEDDIPETLTDSENALHSKQTDDDIEQVQSEKTTTEEIFKSAAKYANQWVSIYSRRLQKKHIPKCTEEKFAEILDLCKSDLELKYNQKGVNKFRVNYDANDWSKLKPATFMGN
jgi:hypothetical protein